MEQLLLNQFPTQIDLVEKYQNTEIYVKRDDLTYYSFGTKIRKYFGLLKEIKKRKLKQIVLFGNLHSNYLASFCVLSKKSELKTFVYSYSKDPKLKSKNSELVIKNSDKIFIENSEKKSIKNFNDENYLDHYICEQFGLNSFCLVGLNSLWDEIKGNYFDFVIVDIGSGLTFLSGIKQKFKNIIGVSIGLKKSKMIGWLQEKKKAFNIEGEFFDNQIFDPILQSRFSKTNLEIQKFIQTYFQKFGILLEPIYSAKSMMTIYHLINEKKIHGKCLYIHQGGTWNFS